MSNPGVIYLVDREIGQHNFRIEDNIGEAIHIHFDEFRIDLSVQELLDLSESCTLLLSEITNVSDDIIRSLDPIFLDEISHMLPYIEEINEELIPLSNLLVLVKYFGFIPRYGGIKNSIFYRTLVGEGGMLENHYQEGLPYQTNLQRLKTIEKSILEHGYPSNNNYIILFNNQNIIRDGQHRASVLFNSFGNIEVPIQRMKFRNSKFNLTSSPSKDFFLKWNKNRVLSAIRFVLRKIRNVTFGLARRFEYSLRKYM